MSQKGSSEVFLPIQDLAPNKKIYFASDFHLGAPNSKISRERELKIIRWLDFIKEDAQAIFLVGDIFDFWFEYRNVVPKGFVRLLGKLAQLSDEGMPLFIFTGNHDLWMFDYLERELNIPVFHEPQSLEISGKKILLGHGDGLGPGDYKYKLLKKVFVNRYAQWWFKLVHPDFGIWLANTWSKKSRASNIKKGEEKFLNEDEWLWQYCKQYHQTDPHDFYIFGHRHLPLDLEVGKTGRYINLGQWLNQFTYASFDGNKVDLTKFE